MAPLNRRRFLTASVAALAAPAHSSRQYHVCLSPTAIENHPGLLETVHRAGVAHVWTTGFMYGHWHYTPERIRRTMSLIRKHGMEAHVVNVPLGHPGDSLGSTPGTVPLIPPAHWKQCVSATGRRHWGTSLHPPAAQENISAIRKLAHLGITRVFVDDDFRLARGPGSIGGCFCPDHLKRFRQLHGYPAGIEEELRSNAQARKLTPALRAWLDFHGTELTACFRAQQAAIPDARLGIMVMYLGAEKAGIRLADYSGVPFRVGELMFDDRTFAPPKGKTDELFSALFHRRFTDPELAYSESTAFPASSLSAANMAAKLAVSTLADVRNTMFMSGLDPFPVSHWDTLGPAMKRHAAIHQELAGHKPRGPFKQFWGEASRYVGDDRPYSLFLATGVPFEVTERPAQDGWTFLSDADAASGIAGGSTFLSRSRTPETLQDLFRLKAELRSKLGEVPLVKEDKPVVCAWYPTARAVLLWNLSEGVETFTVEFKRKNRTVSVAPLDIVLLKGVG